MKFLPFVINLVARCFAWSVLVGLVAMVVGVSHRLDMEHARAIGESSGNANFSPYFMVVLVGGWVIIWGAMHIGAAIKSSK